jgi:hypothetical protein
MRKKIKWWQTTSAVLSFMLILGPVTAAQLRHDQDATMHLKSEQSAHVTSAPSYDDPSKKGGEVAYSEPISTAPAVHVQPHGKSFDPNSTRVTAVRKRVNDIDAMLRSEDQELDRKLIICIHC